VRKFEVVHGQNRFIFTANVRLNGEMLRALPLRSEIRPDCALSPLLLGIALKVLATAIRQKHEKRNKRHPNW